MKCTDKNYERAIKTNCLTCACEEAISIGQEFERERIIKLLEPRLAAMGSNFCMCHTISEAAIRLIKEENK